MSDLPVGWVAAPLGELLSAIVGGGTPSKSNADYFRGSIPFMTVKDMHERFVADTQDHITEQALDSSASSLIPADTLVVASRMSLGKITRPQIPVAINQDLKALFLHDGFDKTYIEYAWRAKESQIQAMGTGTTVKGIRLEDIRGLEIPVAPSAEQTRIADQLDKLLARAQACNDRIDAIPALLKRFRHAVLDAATSGDLTHEWRQALQGKGNDDEIASSDHNLPRGWNWSCAEDIRVNEPYSFAIGPFGSNLKVSDYTPSGVPLVFVREIRSKDFSGHRSKFVSTSKAESLSAHSILGGDLLVTKMGDPPGDVAVYPSDAPMAIITADCIKLRVDSSRAIASFIGYAIEATSTRERLLRKR